MEQSDGAARDEQPQILEPPPPPSTTGARLLDEQLRAADAARVAEKKRIAAARKQIEQERTALAVRQAASHKVAHAEALRQEKRALLHRHINAELAHAEPASEQLLDALAARLAARHAEMCERDVNVVSQHPATPSWFKLFREVDADGSGLIDYSEFESMVREMLNLDEEEVAERSLMAAWLALDTDNSGHIQSGEFGAFMRRGEHVYRDASAPSWREKLLAERRGKADARRKQREEYMSGGRTPRGAARRAAAGGELDALSALLNRRLAASETRPCGRGSFAQSWWWALFRRADADASGLIDFAEFHAMLRSDPALRLGTADVSDAALRRAWRALDADGAGRIDHGTFCRFMRRGWARPPIVGRYALRHLEASSRNQRRARTARRSRRLSAQRRRRAAALAA